MKLPPGSAFSSTGARGETILRGHLGAQAHPGARRRKYRRDGAVVMSGGFGLCGNPENLIKALPSRAPAASRSSRTTAGPTSTASGPLLKNRQIRKMISSYVGENKEFERQFLSGELEVELCPQGTLAERIRAGGAGIGGFFTPTGVGHRGRRGQRDARHRRRCPTCWSTPLTADFALVKAWKADTHGQPRLPQDRAQLQPHDGGRWPHHHRRGRGARAGRRARPDTIHTPGIFVQRILVGDELREVDRAAHGARRPGGDPGVSHGAFTRCRWSAAEGVAQELRDGYYVNLGIGMPTLVANYIPEGMEVVLHSENGMMGIGPFPTRATEDADLINAGKQTVTADPRHLAFLSAELRDDPRRPHRPGGAGCDGGLREGDLANWMIPGKMVKGMGGAMDLVAGARRVIVAMEHVTKANEPKIVKQCRLPVTGLRCVHRIVTDYAVIDVTSEGLVLVERAAGMTVEQIQAVTEPRLIVRGEVPEIVLS
jgi:3-oxoacid CoA-transferase